MVCLMLGENLEDNSYGHAKHVYCETIIMIDSTLPRLSDRSTSAATEFARETITQQYFLL